MRGWVGLALSGTLCALLVATAGWCASAATARGVGTPALERARAIPRLVPATSRLRDECVGAATRVGFVVPCPQLVPSRSGMAMSCPPPSGAASSLPPCVGLEGLLGYPIFFLELQGFDVPASYQGINGKPVGHLTLEAHRLVDDPLKPCIGGRAMGTVRIGTWSTSEFTCPNDSPTVERDAKHGEGAYVGHLALAWTVDRIRYIASAHGHTTANLTLLKRFVRSIVLVVPGSPSG